MVKLLRNVLIFHVGALGDFILTWALALALARIHPQSRILYVTHGAKGKLAERLLGVESMDIEAGWHELYGQASRLPPPAAARLEGAHAIYTFIANARWIQNVQSLAPKADVIPLDPRPPEHAQDHAEAHFTEQLLAQLTGRPAVAEALRQMINSVRSRGITSRTRSHDDTVVIHPGSGAREKCWPVERFVELARRLQQAGRTVRFVVGEVEVERLTPEQMNAFKEVAQVVQPSDYVALAEALSRSAVFIGNDSGPSHLAAALGLPTVALFGPTDDRVWRPIGPAVQVIRRSSLSAITTDEVLSAVSQLDQ